MRRKKNPTKPTPKSEYLMMEREKEMEKSGDVVDPQPPLTPVLSLCGDGDRGNPQTTTSPKDEYMWRQMKEE